MCFATVSKMLVNMLKENDPWQHCLKCQMESSQSLTGLQYPCNSTNSHKFKASYTLHYLLKESNLVSQRYKQFKN